MSSLSLSCFFMNTAKEVRNSAKNYFSKILNILIMALRKPPICEIMLERVIDVISVTKIYFYMSYSILNVFVIWEKLSILLLRRIHMLILIWLSTPFIHFETPRTLYTLVKSRIYRLNLVDWKLYVHRTSYQYIHSFQGTLNFKFHLWLSK
jgi:hypothetical protein